MSVRDDTPEDGASGPPGAGHDGADAEATPQPGPERKPLGYYYDDGTNYETYNPRAEEEGEGEDGETGANL